MITIRSYLNDETIQDHENVAAFARVVKKSDCCVRTIRLRSHSTHGKHITVAWTGPDTATDQMLVKLVGDTTAGRR